MGIDVREIMEPYRRCCRHGHIQTGVANDGVSDSVEIIGTVVVMKIPREEGEHVCLERKTNAGPHC